uniref:Uncharacterized protein n=1 Tax=Salix viminalis TaxID=40686 RepID=A0A6N2MSA0_SALVM
MSSDLLGAIWEENGPFPTSLDLLVAIWEENEGFSLLDALTVASGSFLPLSAAALATSANAPLTCGLD